MNGAALRSGTIRDGTEVTTPAIVGAFERNPEWTTVEAAAAAVVEAPVLLRVIEAMDEAAVVEDGVVDDGVVDDCVVVVFLPVTVARSGRSVGVVCCACAVKARRIATKAAQRRRVEIEAIVMDLFYAVEKFSMRNRLSSSERLE